MNAKFSHYVRQTLRAADDLNATVEELYNRHKSDPARELILDLYILEAERRRGTRKKNQKDAYYEVSFSRQNRKTQAQIASKIVGNSMCDEGI